MEVSAPVFLAGVFLAGAFLAGAFLTEAFLAEAFLAEAFLAEAFSAALMCRPAASASAIGIPSLIGLCRLSPRDARGLRLQQRVAHRPGGYRLSLQSGLSVAPLGCPQDQSDRRIPRGVAGLLGLSSPSSRSLFPIIRSTTSMALICPFIASSHTATCS
ncbi:hypothetical protein D9V37_16415 [Nocardioides mangrovicus]|uniref:Uncharacterized protein n=1 Tax=Nocardioides mangrovicus TaxID=2478913 RepID=A0A3L8NYJ2_9ACTN|nr:hypothetical protein D9V37_16415 [Nocardioides mangrovicus]